MMAHEVWFLWWPTDKAHGRHTLAWLPTPGARLVNELGWGWGLAVARRRGRVQLVGGVWVGVWNVCVFCESLLASLHVLLT